MPRKKVDDVNKVKEKKSTLFDLIAYITYKKKPWEELTIEEQKLFNVFMINRFLSMDLYLCEAINQLQQYTLNCMNKKDVYKLYFHLLPTQRFDLRYIKSKNEIPQKDLDLLKKYFKLSSRECEDYWLIFNKDEEGKKELENIKDNFVYEN